MKLWIVLKNDKPIMLTEYPEDFADGETVRRARPGDLYPSLVADYLDQKCEDCNRHDYVGAHKALFRLLCRELEARDVHAVMRAILRRGGLHKMAGC